MTNQSRIPARLTFLKPLSAAVAIGTGGPFGAKDRSSPRAAPWARSSVKSSRRPRQSGRRCWPRAQRQAWRRRSEAPSRRCCWPSSYSCSSSARVRSSGGAGERDGCWGAYGVDGSGSCIRHAPAQPTERLRAHVYIVLGAFLGLIAVGVTRVVYAIEDGFESCRSTGWGGRRSGDGRRHGRLRFSANARCRLRQHRTSCRVGSSGALSSCCAF